MYIERKNGWEKHLDFMILDLLCMSLSFYLAYIIRHGIHYTSRHSLMYWRLLGVLIVLNLCVVFFRESYKSIVRRGYLIELKETVINCMVVDALLLFYMFLLQQTAWYSRESLIIFCILQVSFCYLTRCIRKYHLRIRMQYNSSVEQMLVLTDEKHARQDMEELTEENYGNYRVIGMVLLEGESCDPVVFMEETAASQDESSSDEFSVGSRINGVPVVSKYKQLPEYILNHVVDSVFINAEMDVGEREVLTRCLVESGVIVHINLICLPPELPGRAVERIGNFTVLTTGMRITTRRQYFLKRVMDVLGGLCGCGITMLATVIFGPIIYIQSPGSVFFRQERVGKNGRLFKIYKFRSMYMDAEERKEELMAQNKMQGLMFKMDNDPRIIPIGRFMRKYSIDELPQFFNVLKGDMSLVGTRPPTVDEFEKYQLHHRGRLNSRPGITGLWQVSGRSDITDFERVVELDTQYIIDWSLCEDIRILWKTVKKVVKGDGAE